MTAPDSGTPPAGAIRKAVSFRLRPQGLLSSSGSCLFICCNRYRVNRQNDGFLIFPKFSVRARIPVNSRILHAQIRIYRLQTPFPSGPENFQLACRADGDPAMTGYVLLDRSSTSRRSANRGKTNRYSTAGRKDRPMIKTMIREKFS